MRKIEQGKAEAKFSGKIKEKDRDLKKAEKARSEMEEQNESSHKVQEMKARQSEKELSAGHKRRLLGMEYTRMKLNLKEKVELDREYRVKTRELERRLEVMEDDLCEIQADKEEQERQVKRAKKRIEDLREYGDGRKEKYTYQIETKEQILEEEIRELEREVKDKVKGIQQVVERKSTLLAAGVVSLMEKLKEVEKDLQELVENAARYADLFALSLCFLALNVSVVAVAS
jgi:hypothetical protein